MRCFFHGYVPPLKTNIFPDNWWFGVYEISFYKKGPRYLMILHHFGYYSYWTPQKNRMGANEGPRPSTYGKHNHPLKVEGNVGSHGIATYLPLRIQVSPKEGISPIILFWWWDWNPQTYSREVSGFLGFCKARWRGAFEEIAEALLRLSATCGPLHIACQLACSSSVHQKLNGTLPTDP